MADFDAILQQTQAHVRAYIAGMGIRAHEVDDLAQDVYIEFYRNFDKMPGDATPGRWLKGIARNVCLNHIRVAARKGRLHQEAIATILEGTSTPADASASEGDVFPALDDCLSTLPPKSRQIVEMRYTRDHTSSEIARLLSRTAESVRVALHRIRTTLRDCILQKLNTEA